MKVINIALRTVGENLKGVGQFGLPFRRNPYATRTAAKVAASAMMKSHIAIFFAGTENAGAVSVRWMSRQTHFSLAHDAS